MHFEHSEKAAGLSARLDGFMREHIYPVETRWRAWVTNHENLWKVWPELEGLKVLAREAGLWNLFLPHEYHEFSPGLTNLDYAPLAEIMGRVQFASEVFNCSAPDTGNMEVLAKYGSPGQQQRWLEPLLDGRIRSAFAMTEPAVASSDATNIQTSIVRDGDDYVVNGRKWWISGILHPHCEILIVLGKTDATAARHAQQSMILVPRDTQGVKIVRALTMMGSHNSPGGEAEVLFENVRVPKDNLILGEGRGFEIAQGRLGPGRIHHCMRLIGMAQRSLELMCRRANTRVAFGKPLIKQSAVQHDIARSRCEIEQARLLTLSAADRMDRSGNKAARDLIAMIKIVAPLMAQTVIDRAMQVHGGMGISGDTPMAEFFAWARAIRFTDGPDEVHMSQLGKLTAEAYGDAAVALTPGDKPSSGDKPSTADEQ
jgi:acyl-CoA dehydrogenase